MSACNSSSGGTEHLMNLPVGLQATRTQAPGHPSSPLSSSAGKVVLHDGLLRSSPLPELCSYLTAQRPRPGSSALVSGGVYCGSSLTSVRKLSRLAARRKLVHLWVAEPHTALPRKPDDACPSCSRGDVCHRHNSWLRLVLAHTAIVMAYVALKLLGLPPSGWHDGG